MDVNFFKTRIHLCREFSDSVVSWVLLTAIPGICPYLPTPPLGQDVTQGSIFKRSLTGLNSEFSFSYTSCLTKAEEPSLPYLLPIAGGRIIGFIPFVRVLVRCEMQSAASRIWTRVVVSISYDDNHYTTGTSMNMSASVPSSSPCNYFFMLFIHSTNSVIFFLFLYLL